MAAAQGEVIKYGRRWDTRKQGESLRPFRIWDANKKRNVRWRCYLEVRNAVKGVMDELRWAKPGTAFEVYDIRSGKLHSQYVRREGAIQFSGKEAK